MHDNNGHTHGHTHSHGNGDWEETLAMLRYMLQHNIHHVDELRELAHDLEHLGLHGQAEEIKGAILDYEAGNARLKKAIGV